MERSAVPGVVHRGAHFFSDHTPSSEGKKEGLKRGKESRREEEWEQRRASSRVLSVCGSVGRF